MRCFLKFIFGMVMLTARQRDQNPANLYDIYLLLCIQYWTPDDRQKTFPKHVDFYSKNKFKKLVRLVGFILRIIGISTLYRKTTFQ